MSTSHHLEGHRRSAHRAAHPQRALGEAPRRCGDRRIRPRRTLALHRAKDLLPRPRILEVQGLLVQGMLVQGRVSMLPLARNRTTGQRWLALRTSRPQPRRGVKDRSVKERLEHIEYGSSLVHRAGAYAWRRLQPVADGTKVPGGEARTLSNVWVEYRRASGGDADGISSKGKAASSRRRMHRGA